MSTTYTHKQIDFKNQPAISSLNIDNNLDVSNLEALFLVTQDFLQDKIDQGKKGKRLRNGQKFRYDELQGVLRLLHSYFDLKGCFSFGICETCKKFGNGISSTGAIGVCRGQEKNWCDTCSEHLREGGGFGL